MLMPCVHHTPECRAHPRTGKQIRACGQALQHRLIFITFWKEQREVNGYLYALFRVQRIPVVADFRESGRCY
jgi:hypothetical protein